MAFNHIILFHLISFHTNEINRKILSLVRHIPQSSAGDFVLHPNTVLLHPTGMLLEPDVAPAVPEQSCQADLKPLPTSAKPREETSRRRHCFSLDIDLLTVWKNQEGPFPAAEVNIGVLGKNLYEYKLSTSLRSAVAIIGTHLPGLLTDKAP